MSEMNDEVGEIDLSEDDLLKKHRYERKEMQAKIQALKKTATKGDKKKKKEVADIIAKLEQELNEQHSSELRMLQNSDSPINTEEPDAILNEDSNEMLQESKESTKVSRAQKRRNKKLAEDKEREKRIVDQEENNKQGPRVIELNTIKEILKSLGLQLHNIPADGNCLYCAINHQLEVTGRDSLNVSKLRKLTAKFMRDNKEEFLPFMYNDDDNLVDEEQFEKYCNDVANTKMWGGQLELRALSNVLQCPIKVIQANGPTTLQGESFNGAPLILAYHRHLYRLGEHYNSTITLEEEHSDGL